jgi:hypothetical protein
MAPDTTGARAASDRGILQTLESPMKPSEVLTPGDREVLVFDELLTPGQILAIEAMFLQIPFARRESFDGELNYALIREEFVQFPALPALLDRLFEALRTRFGVAHPDVGFGHAYAAVLHPNDRPVPHVDGKTSQAMSFLYYANPHWNPAWEGETVFFDAHESTAASVTPRPGRIVAFPANLLHRGGAPHPHAPLLRHTISVFYHA